MPKPFARCALYEECRTLSIAELKELGFLEENSMKTGVVSWGQNGPSYGAIGISVDTLAAACYVEFSYTCNKEPIIYKIHLVTLPSNLGHGKVWYFFCPITRKLCRKLYLVDKYFLHRTAIQG